MSDRVDEAMLRFRAEHDPDDATVEAAVERVLLEIRASARLPLGVSAPPRRRTIQITPARCLVAAILVAAAAILIPLRLAAGGAGAQAAAAAELESTAARVLQGQPVRFPPGRYWYVRTPTWERWIAPDGSGGSLPASGDTQGDIATAPGGLLTSLRSLIANPSLASLPRDPKALRAYLEQRQKRLPGAKSGDGLEANLFASLGVTASFLPHDARLLAALYRVMASLPGIRDGGVGRDARGRTGRIYYDTAWQPPFRYETLLDPASGEVLETRLVFSSRTHPRTERDTILQSGLVTAIGRRPDGTRLDTSGWARH